MFGNTHIIRGKFLESPLSETSTKGHRMVPKKSKSIMKKKNSQNIKSTIFFRSREYS